MTERKLVEGDGLAAAGDDAGAGAGGEASRADDQALGDDRVGDADVVRHGADDGDRLGDARDAGLAVHLAGDARDRERGPIHPGLIQPAESAPSQASATHRFSTILLKRESVRRARNL